MALSYQKSHCVCINAMLCYEHLEHRRQKYIHDLWTTNSPPCYRKFEGVFEPVTLLDEKLWRVSIRTGFPWNLACGLVSFGRPDLFMPKPKKL